jgi:hydrogenase maturation protein HypF
MIGESLQSIKIHIEGIVQGVGFRPFIYNLAQRYQLTGWVKNTSGGVFIEATGLRDNLDSFLMSIQKETPPLAAIDKIETQNIALSSHMDFTIIESSSTPGEFLPVSADVAICNDCLQELFDRRNRRYRYPFINCTNCGPRFTIIQEIPYDRPLTTMRSFSMCPECHAEYSNPSDRRFHAQPIACPSCGPQIWLENDLEPKLYRDRNFPTGDFAILEAQRLILEGRIVAIKGLGGFHLACDACNERAVLDLRDRKLRVDKPFAVMMPDLKTVATHCFLSPYEEKMLLSKERPILVLQRRPDSSLARIISPKQNTIGVMLPYTPLHYLLFSNPPDENGILTSQVWVMTSGNLSEEPIAFTNEGARQKLSGLADAFLFHNRDIFMRCDDSVGRAIEFQNPNPAENDFRKYFLSIRRARGYAPSPLRLPWESPPILSVGAELKNTFCLAKKKYAFMSHYIGDMHNYETLESFEEGISHFTHIFRTNPEFIAYDLHPDYLSTRFAQEWASSHQVPSIAIQHHHAHVASAMAENGLEENIPVIGIALDGTGFGEDGNIWGGEFLIANYNSYVRKYHLDYFPLPGGDSAIKKPAKVALAFLWKAKIDWDPDFYCVQHFCAQDLMQLKAQLGYQINTPYSSSMGRLFDCVASLINLRHSINYEAQAAIELEAIADHDEKGVYPFEFESERIITDFILQAIIADLQRNVSPSTIAARFHNTIAQIVIEGAVRIRNQYGIKTTVLSGGVWQNMRLWTTSIAALEARGFEVLFHHQVPANDSGISLGQVAIAHHAFTGSSTLQLY